MFIKNYCLNYYILYLLQVLGSVLVGILTIKSINTLINYSDIPSSLNISLSHYDDSNVYYRAGDNSSTNLKPVFVVLSKKNQATVKEIPPTNYIINGKIIGVMKLHVICFIKYLVNTIIIQIMIRFYSTHFRTIFFMSLA